MNRRAWVSTRVLVTGARGFIATRLCRALVERGASVDAVSKQPSSITHPAMRWSRVDLGNIDETRHTLKEVRPDVVFHLAGHVTGSERLEEVLPTFAANLVSTVHVLTAAAELAACRVVLAGSMLEPHDERSHPSPSSPYAASKWACTAYARMFHHLYGLQVGVARPMMVYGPGQWDREKLLPYVIQSFLGGASPILASGQREIDWVFVDDVVEGLMAVAASSALDGEPIDLGTGTLTSIRHVVEELARLTASTAQPQFGAKPERLFEVPRVARVEDTKQRIGWQAVTPLVEGLARTVSWYKQNLDTVRLC
jgi:UDP-glucose 4-epimerase